ncbi:MAG: hypothetical protein AAF182_00800 [Pseudomonadota bacterium]
MSKPSHKTKRSVYHLTLLLLLSFLPLKAAQAYDPGTGGYLYEECQKTLERSENLRDAHDSYCGAFIEGYVMGLMVVNTGDMPKPSISDPCRIDKEKAYNHINNRFCSRFPKIKPDNTSAGKMIGIVSSMLDQWVARHPRAMNQNVVDAFEPILQPGEFCNDLSDVDKTDEAHINHALKNVSWSDLLGAKSLVSIDAKYEQCKADIANSGKSSKHFKTTKCGAEILGFMTGARSTKHIQENRIHSTNLCAKPIARVYDSLDVDQTMCVHANTDPLLVARIFTQNYKLIKGKPEKKWGWAELFDAGDLGAVGYETIYRGFLCRNESELANR